MIESSDADILIIALSISFDVDSAKCFMSLMSSFKAVISLKVDWKVLI